MERQAFVQRACLIAKPDHSLMDIYSSWPPRAQSPLDQARASTWGGVAVWLPCTGESGRVNLGQLVTSNCGPAVRRNLPRAVEAVRPSGAWRRDTCTLSLGPLGTGPEELGEGPESYLMTPVFSHWLFYDLRGELGSSRMRLLFPTH